MNYNDVFNQWNALILDVQGLQENINSCINEKGYSNEKEEQDLSFMQRGSYELLRVLFGYFD